MKINLTRDQMREISKFVESSNFDRATSYALQIKDGQIDTSDLQANIENHEKARRIFCSEIELMHEALVSFLVYFDACVSYPFKESVVNLLSKRAETKVREVLLR